MNRNIIIGAFAVVAGLAAVIYANWPSGNGLRVADQGKPKSVVSPRPEFKAKSKPQPDLRPLRPAPSQPQAEQKPERPAGPSFDLVRITPDGEAVIAGRATPDSKVTVYNGDSIVGQATADNRGEWVVVPETPLPAGSTRLSVDARGADGTFRRSEKIVVLVVPERRVKRDKSASEPRQALAVLVDKLNANRV